MNPFSKWLIQPSSEHRAVEISRLAKQCSSMKDSELKTTANSLKARAQRGDPLQSLLSEAFSLVIVAAERSIGLRPFDVQIQGGIALAKEGALVTNGPLKICASCLQRSKDVEIRNAQSTIAKEI